MKLKKTINAKYEMSADFLFEFIANRTALIKKRVRLLCVLAASLYTGISIISAIILPEEFQPTEVIAWVVLIIGSILIAFLSSKARSFKAARLNAYLFIAFLLIVLTKINIIYYQYIDTTASVYLIVLFLVSSIIPWKCSEVIPIGIMHFIAYCSLVFYTNSYIPQFVAVRPYWYFDGILLLSVGFILCFIVRRKETIREIENFILLKEIEKKNAQMEKELELATLVHARLIPHSINTDKAEIAATYAPAYYMGGDYGRFNFSTDDKLIFIICDVTGHGVSAALLVNTLHGEFERLAKEGKEPGLLLKNLDSFIRSDFAQINMYLSAFCGLLDYRSGEFIYSNYGHPPQYIYRRASSNIQRITSQTGWLGLPVESSKVYQDKMPFDKGDQILLFTDGIVEAANVDNQFYGDERLEKFFQKNNKLSPELFNQRLLGEVNSFSSNNLKDDIFILNILIK